MNWEMLFLALSVIALYGTLVIAVILVIGVLTYQLPFWCAYVAIGFVMLFTAVVSATRSDMMA